MSWEPGQPIPVGFDLPCGHRATFHHSSGISFICQGCFAVVGSIGMPKDCADLLKMENASKNGKY